MTAGVPLSHIPTVACEHPQRIPESANPQFEIRNPQSGKSAIRNPKSAIKRHLARVLAALLLAVFVARLYHSIKVHSLTADEPMHIAAGFAHLADRDFRVNPEHPPLAKMTAVLLPHLTAGRVAIDSLKYPGTEDSMNQYVDDFSAALGPKRQEYIDRARIGPVILSTLLAVLLFMAARRFYRNEWISLAILFVYTMEPTILAHSTIVHTDVPAAFGYLAGFLSLCWWWHRPSVARAAALGAVMALACLCKFSMLLLPVFGILLWGIKLWMEAFRPGKPSGTEAGAANTSKRKVLSDYLFQLFIAATLFYFLILAGYFFADIYRPLHPQASFYRLVWPGHFFRGIYDLMEHEKSGHDAYFFGEFSRRGWWFYFPAAFVLKVPLAALLLFAVGTISWMRRRASVERSLWLLMVASYAASSVFSSINIGVRHLLPLFPLLMLAVGEGVKTLLEPPRRIGALVCLASLIWLGTASFWAHPHYLVYFNELIGGPSCGWKYLSDSNTDWGQNSRLWAKYARQHPRNKFFTALHQADPPANYGVTEQSVLDLFFEQSKDTASDDLEEGSYAVSTTFLISQRVPQLAFLRGLEPVDQVGYTIRVYRITEAEQDQYMEWLKSWKPNRAAAY
ncbi:MAG TPA: phospholipid carrier-dependent glycosyltransferase [Acidobacteriota bacterium]|nr:phospholipid carrier-dependent glycosyltransferase [Acidobacteriota bacterium]